MNDDDRKRQAEVLAAIAKLPKDARLRISIGSAWRTSPFPKNRSCIDMALFEKGMPKQGGRAKGIKNRLSHAFLVALAEDFEKHGIEAIRITRIERPAEYCKIVAALLPRELEITTSVIHEISDEDLEHYLEYAQRELEQRSRSLTVGEGATTPAEPAQLLLPIRETKTIS